MGDKDLNPEELALKLQPNAIGRVRVWGAAGDGVDQTVEPPLHCPIRSGCQPGRGKSED